jgi:hypothetical protein
MAKKDGGGGGLFAQAKRELNAAKQGQPQKGAAAKPGATTPSKRVTPPKNRPTPSSGRPASSGKSPRQREQRPKKK